MLHGVITSETTGDDGAGGTLTVFMLAKRAKRRLLICNNYKYEF